MEEMQNIWNRYGLKENPFSTSPLSPYGDGLPIKKAFLGRDSQIRTVKRTLYSNQSSRILVYGDIGVGKTSFVNYVKAEAMGDKFFVPLGELSTQYDWTPEDFMFYTVSIIFETIDRSGDVREKFDKKLFQKLNVVFGIDRGGSMGGGVEVLGFGGSVEKGRTYGPPRLNATTVKLLLQDALNEIRRIGFRGTIIHYNNLELVQDKGENQLKRIMNGIRDFLQADGAHFIFVSDTKLYELFQQLPRVEDIFQTPVHIPVFKDKEIEEIINLRIQMLRISESITPVTPFDEKSLKTLFGLYGGNLRGILRSLECAVNETAQNTPVIITQPILNATLFKFAKNRYLSKFSKEDANAVKILKRILETRETTNKSLAEHFKMKPQNVSNALRKLKDIGAIKLSRTDGTSKFFVPSQEALWLLLEPEPGFAGQTRISGW